MTDAYQAKIHRIHVSSVCNCFLYKEQGGALAWATEKSAAQSTILKDVRLEEHALTSNV